MSYSRAGMDAYYNKLCARIVTALLGLVGAVASPAALAFVPPAAGFDKQAMIERMRASSIASGK